MFILLFVFIIIRLKTYPILKFQTYVLNLKHRKFSEFGSEIRQHSEGSFLKIENKGT